MKRQGILFQGLYLYTKDELSFLREESYYHDEIRTENGNYVDITYFLLYAVCKNPETKVLIKTMEQSWRDYILSMAMKSSYRNGEFWEYLDSEEKEDAEILLGLLEEIRNCGKQRTEKSWITFWYIFNKSVGREYDFLSEEKVISFEKICHVASRHTEIPLLGCAYICVAFLWAENLGIEILRDGTYYYLYPCLQEGIKIWRKAERDI